jgi:tRNA 2-thiouridine synthesizing protein A
MDADKNLDCTGLRCPMPVAKVNIAMKKMTDGETLQVIATDPTFGDEIKAWSDDNGHTILALENADNKFEVFLKKGL